MMVRTQIQLEAEAARLLKALAVREGRSMADLIREGIDLVLARADRPDDAKRRRRALAVVGAFHSKRGDVAKHHDEHLAEAFDS